MHIIRAEWHLVWHDEFESDLDHFYNRWHVVDDVYTCDGMFLSFIKISLINFA